MTTFRIYGLGIVAKDKLQDSWDVEIYPVEELPSADGGLTDIENIKEENKDIGDKITSIDLKKGYTITCRCFMFGYNRASAPDLHKGETVLIFIHGEGEMYYCIPFTFEADKRKLEKVLNFYTARPEIKTEDDLLKSGYYTLIDTIGKSVELHTSTANQEIVGYDVKLDTNSGYFSLADTKGNSIKMDSKEGDLSFKTLKTANILTGTLTTKVSESINTECKTFTFKALEASNIETKSLDVKVKEAVNMEFKTIKMSNGSDELITVMIDLVKAMQTEKHLGNLGAPTQLDPGTLQKYVEIEQKLTKFKG